MASHIPWVSDQGRPGTGGASPPSSGDQPTRPGTIAVGRCRGNRETRRGPAPAQPPVSTTTGDARPGRARPPPRPALSGPAPRPGLSRGLSSRGAAGADGSGGRAKDSQDGGCGGFASRGGAGPAGRGAAGHAGPGSAVRRASRAAPAADAPGERWPGPRPPRGPAAREGHGGEAPGAGRAAGERPRPPSAPAGPQPPADLAASWAQGPAPTPSSRGDSCRAGGQRGWRAAGSGRRAFPGERAQARSRSGLSDWARVLK